MSDSGTADFWKWWEKKVQEGTGQDNTYTYTYPAPQRTYPNVCPGCGRCRHCGQPTYPPYTITWTTT